MRAAWHIACLVAAIICSGASSATVESAAYFGEWFLSSLFQVDAPHSYRIGQYVDNNQSALLDIVCTGNQYRLRFFPNTTVSGDAKGVVALAIDRRDILMLDAAVETKGGVPIAVMFEAALAQPDLDLVASAQSAIVLTSPALRKSYTFKAEQTAKAVRVLRASCQD
jgi:hypothetical protein